MTIFGPAAPALALSLALAAPALAQGTDAQRAACTPDVWRLCASHIPSVPAITGCLRRESARLSPACRTAMQEATGAPAARRAEAAPAARPAPESRPERRPERVAAAARPAPQARLRGPERMRERAQAPAPRGAARVRVAARYGLAPRVAMRRVAHHRRARPYGGFGGGEMRQARYWMNRLGGFAGMAGFDGAALAGIREMRVGQILDMMQ